MTAAEFLAASAVVNLHGLPVQTARRAFICTLIALGEKGANVQIAIEELACDAGWCPACGSTGEVETGGRSANDPFRERQTCQECKG